jgi:signal peptidase II
MVSMNDNPIGMMKNRYYLIVCLIVILDHVTKWIAQVKLYPDQMVDIIPGYLRLSCVYNSGVAFGFFDEIQSVWKPYILAAMAIVAIAVIFLYGMRMPAERKLLQLALGITMGGILGNFIDRVFRGYVVDFIEFHIYESFHWPTFNVADSAITVGIAFLLIDTVKNPGLEEAAAPTAMNDRP